MIIKMASAAIGGLTVLASAGAAYGDPVAIPYNQATDIGGVTVVCTGTGQSRQNPEWDSFPVRVEFAATTGHFLGDVAVVLSKPGGGKMVEASCKGPWMLFKVPPGSYQVEGRLNGSEAQPQTASVTAPATGQARVVLRFPKGS